MNVSRCAGLVLVTLLGVTAAQAPTHAAERSAPAPTALLAVQTVLVGVDAGLDLAEAHPAHLAGLAATKLPGPRECSFVPSKNAVKPKKNACRFA